MQGSTMKLSQRTAQRCSGISRATSVRPLCVARPQAARSKPVADNSNSVSQSWIALTTIASFLEAAPALAKDGEYGILEGRTAALVHPAMEFFLLGAMLYSGYLGWQWRRARELGEEIRALKAAAPAAAGDAPAPENPAITEKEQERKSILAAGVRDKHFMWGSLLLASGVGIAIEGCVNTYMRTGRLFPGPHLYAGATICALWAIAAAQVPAMQKGDQNARNLHIALNAIQVGLFLWQVPTGLEIVGKVFQFTSWP